MCFIYMSHMYVTYTCAQSCLPLCDPMDCSLPGSSDHELSQTRVLESVAISYSRGSSRPRDWIHAPASPKLTGRFFTTEQLGSPMINTYIFLIYIYENMNQFSKICKYSHYKFWWKNYRNISNLLATSKELKGNRKESALKKNSNLKV